MQDELCSVHLNATFFTHSSDSEDKILLSSHIKKKNWLLLKTLYMKNICPIHLDWAYASAELHASFVVSILVSQRRGEPLPSISST